METDKIEFACQSVNFSSVLPNSYKFKRFGSYQGYNRLIRAEMSYRKSLDRRFGGLISMHLMLQPIFECHPDQNPQPFE